MKTRNLPYIAALMIAFVLLSADGVYAVLQVDDMALILEDEMSMDLEFDEEDTDSSDTVDEGAVAAEDGEEITFKDRLRAYYERGRDALVASDGGDGVADSEMPVMVESDAAAETGGDRAVHHYPVEGKAVSSIDGNYLPFVIGGSCGLIFTGIAVFFYVRVKKLAERAQVSKDMAEKYLYDMQSHGAVKNGSSRDAIREEVASRITAVDEKIDRAVAKKVKDSNRKLAVKISEILAKLQSNSYGNGGVGQAERPPGKRPQPSVKSGGKAPLEVMAAGDAATTRDKADNSSGGFNLDDLVGVTPTADITSETDADMTKHDDDLVELNDILDGKQLSVK